MAVVFADGRVSDPLNAYFWGGVGVGCDTIFVALEHMVDATQQLGLGLGLGWDVIPFVAHERMVDATQQLGLGKPWPPSPANNIFC